MALSVFFLLVPCRDEDIEVCHTLAKMRLKYPVIRVSPRAFDSLWKSYVNTRRCVYKKLWDKGIRNIFVDESVISLALENGLKKEP